MNIPAIDQFARRRVGRQRRGPAASTPTPPATLTLAAASASFEEPAWVRLAFDRAIDFSGLNPGAILVTDGAAQQTYAGSGAGLAVSETEVEVALVPHGAGPSADVLTATAGTGIVAADDGGTWAGVAALPWPWPPA